MVQVAVKQQVVDYKKIQIQFFSQGKDGVVVDTPVIQENGSISFWPKGFFDQFQKDLIELM